MSRAGAGGGRGRGLLTGVWGGGAGPGRHARRVLVEQWPILLVGGIFMAAFVLAAANFWRRGALLIGIGVGVAAVLRVVLTEERAGLLVVRGKGLDLAMTTAVAVAMLYTASTIDPLGTQ